jgi:hypothetical protein
MKVSVSWPDMDFCFVPRASHHHKADVGCANAPFDLTAFTYIIKGSLLYQEEPLMNVPSI